MKIKLPVSIAPIDFNQKKIIPIQGIQVFWTTLGCERFEIT